MDEDTKVKLARRAVASKYWRWMDGAHWVNGSTDGPGDVFADGGESSHYPRFGVILRGEFFEQEDYNPCMPEEPLPDLDDPATLGCLLALVRVAWAPSGAGKYRYTAELLENLSSRYRPAVAGSVPDWVVEADDMLGQGATEAEALVCALEAAP